MRECVEDFKLELDGLYDEMYDKLDKLIYNTLIVMSVYEESDDNLEILKQAIIEVAEKRVGGLAEGLKDLSL